MRSVVVFVVLAMAAAACAGMNPDVKIYVSFDPSGSPVHSIETELYTACDTYIVLSDLDGGTAEVALRLSNPTLEYPGVLVALSFQPMWWGP